jgi:hypothetical protein
MWLGDPIYYTTVLPALVISSWASVRYRAAYRTGSRVKLSNGLSGAELAGRLLEDQKTVVKCVSGPLSNYYDPRGRVLRLSVDVFHGRTLAALGIAAHEMGHALQQCDHVRAAAARRVIVPIATLGSQVCWMFVAAGYLLGMLQFYLLAIALFSANVALQLANLVIEHDASRRAVSRLRALGVVDEAERAMIENVVHAAPMTHVAATLTGVAELFVRIRRPVGLIDGSENESGARR